MPRLSAPGVAFIDRDGTINAKPQDGHYITGPEAVTLLPGAATAIRRLNDAKIATIVITNQRGIDLGLMDERDLNAVHARLGAELAAAAGARIDGFFHCPHGIGVCDCRKPGTGLFRQARQRHPWIDFTRSAMVGDAPSDVEAGRRLGMATVLLGSDAPDLRAAVDLLLA